MKRTKIKNCYKMPNVIIEDTQLTYSAKAVAAIIYGHSNVLGFCRLGLRRVARKANCSVATAAQAVQQLMSQGYIDAYKNYGWHHNAGRLVYKNYTYVCRLNTQKNFTFVPRTALAQSIKKSSFVVYLQLRRLAGNAMRAYPSLHAISDAIGMAKATVCRALSELASAGLIYIEHCVKTNGAYSCNSYFFTSQDKPDSENEQHFVIRFDKSIIRPENVEGKSNVQKGVVSFLRNYLKT